VRGRLEEATHYWLATVRPDGRPHTVPLDGVWVDDCWYFGGSPEAVKHRNLSANPRAVVTLEDAVKPVIVEGHCEVVYPDDQLARRLSEQSGSKYDYGRSAALYKKGVWQLRPERVLAWAEFPRDATRFVFQPA
jgi:nitroimidazol reductase NimA-like FMN-containing flavoprotein (pyridoxamine 5'-phosphate oxidase superfamily)